MCKVGGEGPIRWEAGKMVVTAGLAGKERKCVPVTQGDILTL